jgi:hypothetical protein
MPSFIVWLRKNVRLYTEGNRIAQLRSAIDSPGSRIRNYAKRVQRLRFRAFRLKNRCLTPALAQFHSTFGCDLHRISAFRRHRGFDLMKARRKRATAAASKGAAKKAPKRKKAAKRKKAKKK